MGNVNAVVIFQVFIHLLWVLVAHFGGAGMRVELVLSSKSIE
jgi:hypothetical protein